MYSGTQTYYFDSEDRAREAQSALRSAGYEDVELHAGSSDSGGETFMDRVREFFGGAPSSDHDGAAFLVVRDADDGATTVIRQYDGRARELGTDSSSDMTDEQRLRLHEERLSVDKQRVNEGEVRVGKDVVTEHQSIDVPVAHDEVYVERRPVSDGATTDAGIGDGREEIRIPVTHEEVEVEKRPVATEEIVIGKRRVEETQTVGADVRKERARIDSSDVDERSVRSDIDNR